MKCIASSLAVVSSLLLQTVAASKYNAICVFDELKCGGSIQLREYTPDTADKCESGDCAAITAPGATTFSTLPTCTDDHVADTEKHLKGKPYVIVESYASGCSGDFTKAVAVVATGTCYPSSKGDMSYSATLGATDLSVKWMQYMDANCSSDAITVNFKVGEVDSKTCVGDTMKVLAVKPGGSSESTPTPSTTSAAPTTTCPLWLAASTVVLAVAATTA